MKTIAKILFAMALAIVAVSCEKPTTTPTPQPDNVDRKSVV